MSDTKWTAGPWQVARWPESSHHFTIEVNTQGYNVARTFGGIFPESQEKANAHMIAAAPELYKALAGLLTGHPSGDSPEQKIGRAALAKARGESQ